MGNAMIYGERGQCIPGQKLSYRQKLNMAPHDRWLEEWDTKLMGIVTKISA